MKYLILLLSLTFISCNTYKKKCEYFHNGKFKYISNDGYNWKVSRNDTLQIEENLDTGELIKGSILWKNPCEYELTFIEFNNLNNNQLLGTKLKVKIIDIKGKSYKYETRRAGILLENWVTKIK